MSDVPFIFAGIMMMCGLVFGTVGSFADKVCFSIQGVICEMVAMLMIMLTKEME